MSGRSHRSGGGRAIGPDEARLWEHATRSLEPVKAKPRVASVSASPPRPSPASPEEVTERLPVSTRGSAPAAGPRSTPAPRAGAEPPPLADFDRRKARRIASGRIEVEARIDLHGLRERDARARLRDFLLAAYADGRRTVLVITGKGDGREEADALSGLLGERRRGVLRRNVPLWLEEPDLRAIVSSHTQAGIRHGGQGALYVQLRKAGR